MKMVLTSPDAACERSSNAVMPLSGAQLKERPGASMPDVRVEPLAQFRHQELAGRSSHAAQLKACASTMATGVGQGQRVDVEEISQENWFEEARPPAVSPAAPVQGTTKPNHIGLSNRLKSGIESLSGMRMDHVKVHYNSDTPAQLNAHAYAQGSEIHVAPGQERHVPHEAWHVVQQAQGRVKPTLQMKQGWAVNDDVGLEQEADLMGGRANDYVAQDGNLRDKGTESPAVLQGAFRITPVDYDPVAAANIHSTFNQADFDNVLRHLNANESQFWTELGLPKNALAKRNFTFPFINANVANQVDLPAMANAVIDVICAGTKVKAGPLKLYVSDLEFALGANAPTRAAEPDQAHFRHIIRGEGVVRSRSKGVPSTISLASLAAASANANVALTQRNSLLVARNGALDDASNYIGRKWGATARANSDLEGIRSPHTNNAGWLPASAVVTQDQALLTAIGASAQTLTTSPSRARRKYGSTLAAQHALAAAASEVEAAIDASPLVEAPTLRTILYRDIFWATVATKADRVKLAWQRYAEENGMPNCAYIEFVGGGDASRIIWNYDTDRYYISAHYNWVDGYNPHFEITGMPASY